MTLAAQMVHRCTVERDRSAGTDLPGGYPAQPDWQPHLVQQPCAFQHARLQFGRFGERIEPARELSLNDWRMYMPSGTDIKRGDRVSAVYDQSGEIVHAGVLQVDGDPFPDPRNRFLTVVLSGVS